MKQYYKSSLGLVLLPVLLVVAPPAPRAEDGVSIAGGDTASIGDTLSTEANRRAGAYTLAGLERLEAGDSEGAIRALQQAMQANPNHAESYFHLGRALKSYGAAPMAVRVLRSYIRLGDKPQLVEQAQEIIRTFGLVPPESPAQALQASGYIGAEACASCHPVKFEGFSQTAHHLTSRPANAATIDGSFVGDLAFMWTRDPNLWFEMSQRPDGLYQSAQTWADNQLGQQSERFDIVIGSGKIGQSYLYWRGDRLFQLPVSHSADTGKWINSPGFRDGEAFFERPIIPRCLECHSTYFQSLQHDKNIHGKGAFMLGISCERCHGPGAAHASFQLQSGAADEARYIVHPGGLEAQQLIDLCAQCHSNTGAPLQDPFAFRPGAALGGHFAAAQESEDGVHAANQVGRLAGSQCFQKSPAMTCITCHNPHELERGKTKLFSDRCLQCHQPEVCAMGPELGGAIRDNCIDCHMPRRRDTDTQIQSPSDLESPLMPDHRIAVYPDATQFFLERQRETD